MRVAVVVPNLVGGGGVPSVARFLMKTIDRSSEFEGELISLATSASDDASVQLRSCSSWFGRKIVRSGSWEGREFVHVGAYFSELEFQRYRPRRVLSRLLENFDLVQVVAGLPAWCLVGRDFAGPVLLQVASLAKSERRSGAQQARGPRALWRRVMTRITARLDEAGIQVADRVLVENRWMKRVVEAWTDPAKVVVAPPGVDTVLFAPLRAVMTEERDTDYILSVGRFSDPRKDVDVLLEAYSQLRDTVGACPRLVLAGETMPSHVQQSRIRKLGLESSVSLMGEVSREELAELYRNATLFVLSSAEEGLGLVLLEAMSSGAAVVATRTHGAVEVVQDGRSGLLTPVGDARGLAAAMERLLANTDLRRALGLGARARVEKRFSESVAGEVFLEAYRDLLVQRQGAASSGICAGRA